MNDDERDEANGAILVVDDDPKLREAVARILENRGHHVLRAPDGPTAVQMAKDHEVDLMVLDYMMPGMDGEMVLGAMDEPPPTLLLTADLQALPRAAEMGAAAGLEKPFRVPDLLDAVEEHLRKLADEAS
ncbi:MAG: response regulator transcription factor [Sandaracinaceae bacterium]